MGVGFSLVALSGPNPVEHALELGRGWVQGYAFALDEASTIIIEKIPTFSPGTERQSILNFGQYF